MKLGSFPKPIIDIPAGRATGLPTGQIHRMNGGGGVLKTAGANKKSTFQAGGKSIVEPKVDLSKKPMVRSGGF